MYIFHVIGEEFFVILFWSNMSMMSSTYLL